MSKAFKRPIRVISKKSRAEMREVDSETYGADRHVTKPNMQEVTRLPYRRPSGEMSIAKHEAMLKKEATGSFRMNFNRGETSSRTVTKYNSKWSK